MDLFPGEFPAILEQGETVLPKGAGGVATAPMVTINIKNETGQQVDAKQENVSFDGDQLIVDVIIKNYQQGGELFDLFGGSN